MSAKVKSAAVVDGCDRRRFLCRASSAAAGVGMWRTLARVAAAQDAHPLAPLPSHHQPRAQHLIFLFLTGGFSHVDTFDPKPALKRDHGKIVPAVHLRGTDKCPLMQSPFKFIRAGQSGLEMSELFPELASVADRLCVIRSLHTDIVEHFQAVMAMHTGSATIPLPSLGAWLSYALGTLNPNLPSHMVLAEHLPYAGSQVFDSHFLPPIHQGVRVTPGDEPIAHLKPAAGNVTLHELERMLLDDANRLHAAPRAEKPRLAARSSSFRTAEGMMREAPDVFDLSHETSETIELYGLAPADRSSFAWQCLIARRLVERGVRVVELIDTGSSDNWDAHGDMEQHRPKARRVDRAIAALVKDLSRRGLLDETLVVCATEFGRTPWTDNGKGRNHYARAFTCLLAGAGVRGGMAYGRTDPFGIDIVENPCHVHDYHATILHLMGIDHTRLTYRYAGRDFRLTDVYGDVLADVLT